MRYRKKPAVVLAFGLVLFVSIVSGLPAQEGKFKAILGTWDGEFDGGKFFEFVFTMKGDTLEGRMVFDKGVEMELSDISFKENKLTCTANFSGKGSGYGSDMIVEFAGDTFSGEISSEKGDSYFSGSKRNKGQLLRRLAR